MDKALKEIIDIDPYIGFLLNAAKNDRSMANALLYNKYMHMLEKRVGYYSPDPRLQTNLAYDIVREALCAALEY